MITQVDPKLFTRAPQNLSERIWDKFFTYLYSLFQFTTSLLFTSKPPLSHSKLRNPLGRVAIIGGGVTGISSAAHLISHGFEVIIYEQKSSLGGIWAASNETSKLQLHSIIYRFHPAVFWSEGYVGKSEILSEVTRIWRMYHLQSRTRFNYTVSKVERNLRSDGKTEWIVDDGKDGIFDALIVATGTCGIPRTLKTPGIDIFKGAMIHSSELDGVNLHDKRVVVVGGGASGVEACELALKSKASDVVLLARNPQWIIPCSGVGALMGTLPKVFPRFVEALFEKILAVFYYRGVEKLLPSQKPLYYDTPVVNNHIWGHVRSGRLKYFKGKLLEVLPQEVRLDVESDGEIREMKLKADVLINATGFNKPAWNKFLPTDELFPKKECSPPNLYLINFSAVDPTFLMANAAYVQGTAPIGNVQIGILTRMLMMFLVQPETAPQASEMEEWLKEHPNLRFFTLFDILIYLVNFQFTTITRLRWAIFNVFGWGSVSPFDSQGPDNLTKLLSKIGNSY